MQGLDLLAQRLGAAAGLAFERAEAPAETDQRSVEGVERAVEAGDRGAEMTLQRLDLMANCKALAGCRRGLGLVRKTGLGAVSVSAFAGSVCASGSPGESSSSKP